MFVKRKTSSRIRSLMEKSRMELTGNRGLTLPGKPMVNTNSFAEPKVSSKSVTTEETQDILADYLECSSVHGIKYTGSISVKVGLLGRLIWICTMITGLVGSNLMVYQFWHRYNTNPTFSYVKTFFGQVNSVPFPGVTFCPFIPNTKERRMKVAKMLVPPGNMTTEELNFIVEHLHDLALAEISAQKRYLPYKQQLDDILKENNWTLPDLLEYSVSCEDIVHSCWFDGVKLSCKDYIRLSHSNKGICCSFNYFLEEIILGHKNVTPLHSTSYGMMSGLKVVLNEEILINNRIGDPLGRVFTNSEGMVVTVHHPLAYPGDILSNRILQSTNEIQLEVQPVFHIVPTGFLHKTERGRTVPFCIPENTTPLKYVPVYRFSNCYTSCKVELMLQFCGCVPFNYQPIARNFSLRSCTLSDYDCLKVNVLMFRIVQDTETENFTCICRQPCKNAMLEVRMSKTTLDQQALRTSPAYKGVTEGQAVVRVFMSSQFLMVHETIAASTKISLLASLGGVFGLFLGCSFISAAEVFYFAVLFYRVVSARFRAARNKRRHRKHNFHEDVKMFH